MNTQKPTVLDAARIAAELDQLRCAVIDSAVAGNAPDHLYLTLRKPDLALKFIVEKRYAYIGSTSVLQRPVDAIPALAGYHLLGASQLGFDRIVQLHLERLDRLGRKQNATLVLEIIPGKGNAILIDGFGSIKWALGKNVGKYVPPPKLKKATILNFDSAQINAAIEKPGQIPETIYGLNDRDLINLRLEDETSAEKSLKSLTRYVSDAIMPGPAWIIYNADKVIAYSLAAPVLQADEAAQEYRSALEMYESYYSRAAGLETEQDRLRSLKRILNREITREESKHSAIRKELENAGAAHTYRLYGELILANIESIKKGSGNVLLSGYGSGETFDIMLDPSKSASANAEEYFKRAKKATSSINILTDRLESTTKKLKQLSDAGKITDIAELEQRMIKLKLWSPKAVSVRKKVVEPRLPYKKFRSSSGWEIWVGRTNRDNDELTFKLAHKDDFWFHAWQAAGSHTILRLPNKNSIPDKQTLLETASLAAYFSKARTSSKVPVAYTRVKFVHKPRNFPPGKVLIEKEKQLMVRPAEPDDYLIKDDE